MQRVMIGIFCLALLAPLALPPETVNAVACSPKARKEVRVLNRVEWSRYTTAVKTLLGGPRPTVYERIVGHYSNKEEFTATHDTLWYLPYHRALLREFE